MSNPVMVGPGKVGHCAGCGDWRLIVDGRGRCIACTRPSTYLKERREAGWVACPACDGQGKLLEGHWTCRHCLGLGEVSKERGRVPLPTDGPTETEAKRAAMKATARGMRGIS